MREIQWEHLACSGVTHRSKLHCSTLHNHRKTTEIWGAMISKRFRLMKIFLLWLPSVILCNYIFLPPQSSSHREVPHLPFSFERPQKLRLRCTVGSIIHSPAPFSWWWATLPLQQVACRSADTYLTSCLHKSWTWALQNSCGKWI